MSNLSAKRLRFVEEYLIDLNGTQAAIRAGYSPATAKVTASRLLSNDNVAEAIANLRGKLSRKLEINTEKVLSELAKIGFANIASFYRSGAGGRLLIDNAALHDPDKAAAVAQIEIQNTADGTQTIKLNLADKKGALIELGKHLGLFAGRTEVAVTHREEKEIDPRRLAMALLVILREGQDVARIKGPLIEA